MSNEKESVAISSVLASAAMTLMKLAVGLMTGSLGILSEAAHSLLDLGAASLTWFAVRVSDKPADAKHPYGHGKIENVSALIETGLLFVTSAWIVKEAVQRLLAEKVEVETTWYSVAVILVSIAIDFFRARALTEVAKKTGSQALEADALHFSSDIWSSSVVLIGLGFVAIGWEKGDAIAAIGVAGFVCLAGWRLGKRTIDVLIDTAPEGVAERVKELATATPGVARIEHVRARPAGATVFVEAVVKIGRGLSLDQVQKIRDGVRENVLSEMPNVDLLVVAEPLTLEDEDVAETVRVAATNLGYSVHDIGLYMLGTRRHVGFDLEIDESLSLLAAHEIASKLEAILATELGSDLGIDIHLDPRRNHAAFGDKLTDIEERSIFESIRQVLALHPKAEGGHHFFGQNTTEGYYISFHCEFAGNTSIKEVHQITVVMEHQLREKLKNVARIVVHAEPKGHID